jgi:aryl carrier-like protein
MSDKQKKELQDEFAANLRNMNLSYDELIEKAALIGAETVLLLDEQKNKIESGLDNLMIETIVWQKKLRASDSAKAMHANDPKQAEKKFIKECWLDWKNKDPKRYRSNTAFADDMLTKCEHLTSHKKITEWCAAWAKEHNPAS